jgi:ABC-2 type transport system ATP-binding protein
VAITVENLSRSYGDQKAVNNISFRLNQGEIVGFLGPNGAGKSTTMKMITGYLQPDAGSIEVCGIASSDEMEVKKKIGYLPEANPLYMDMYVREYLQFLAGVHKVDAPSERIESVISMVGLLPEANKKIGQLSKGYKQRVGLAAALIHDPEVLILDEPTSGLDPNQIIEIRNVIRDLSKKKTILFSSHIMQEVEAICDRVIIINKGTIVADDSLSKLRSSGSGQASVLVEFKEQVDPSMLESLPGVIAVTTTNKNVFRISCNDAEGLKKELLRMSIDSGLNIISLQSQSNNLESVFKSLTT